MDENYDGSIDALYEASNQAAKMPCPPLTAGPRKIGTEPRDGTPFLGMIWSENTDGTYSWELVEMLSWYSERLFNHGSGNYYPALYRHLTHWMPMPSAPSE